MSIKNWISDFKYNLEHSRNSKWLNSELVKKYYKPKSNSIIKILSEIEKKAGLSSFNIVPYLIKINLMGSKEILIEEGSAGHKTERDRNDELFKELEELGFIKILETNPRSFLKGQGYKTPTSDFKLVVKLLPKGVDYLAKYNQNKFSKNVNIISVLFSASALLISLYSLSNPMSDNYDKLEKKVDSIAKILDNSINYEKK